MSTIGDAISTETDQDTLKAVTGAARRGARDLARTKPAERAGWLHAVADALDAEVEELVVLADEETSLGSTRLHAEVRRTTGQLRPFAEVLLEGSYLEATIDHADPSAAPPKPDLRRMLVPLGPVAVFTASNFPFAFSAAGGDSASALASGCPVVVKAHPGHPRLSARTAASVLNALLIAGAPHGTFAMIEGHDIGRALVVDPAIQAVAFTGSLAGGRLLLDLATSRPEPIPFDGEAHEYDVVRTARAAVTGLVRSSSPVAGPEALGERDCR